MYWLSLIITFTFIQLINGSVKMGIYRAVLKEL
jgi:hypothetical protein